VQTALEAVLGVGNFSVTGVAGGPYTVTFTGTFGKTDVAQLTSGFVSGSGTATLATTMAGGAQPLTLGGAGNTAIPTALGSFLSLTKIGAGTASLSAASPTFIAPLTVSGGTFAVNGAGAIGTTLVSGLPTSTIQLNPTSSLLIDDTGTAVTNRLAQRIVSTLGGNISYVGSAAGISEFQWRDQQRGSGPEQ
jgi:autotransporter-associated beta strand protein